MRDGSRIRRGSLGIAKWREVLPGVVRTSPSASGAASSPGGAGLISVTVSLSGSSIEFASAAMMRTDAGDGDGGGTTGGTTGGGTTTGGCTTGGCTTGGATVVACPCESVIHDWLWNARNT